MGMSPDAGVVALKNLALLCVCAGVVILIGYLAYSQTGCSLVCPDGNGTSELAFVIEGDLDPSDQMLRVSVSGHDADANTEVTINNMTYSVNTSEETIILPNRTLNCGRNHILIRSRNRTTATTATVSYEVQWKPLIKQFHIAGLRVGDESDFFIYADSDVSQSYLCIEKENGEVVLNQTFNGTKIRITIDEIGNYGVYMRVLGSGWSDMYYSEFTAFAGVSRTTDNVPLIRSKTDEMTYPSVFPLTIDRKDCGVVLILKRAANGYHRLICGRLLPYLSHAKKLFL